ncbi:MAG: hypothetical protein ACRDGN_01550 [bacterium]
MMIRDPYRVAVGSVPRHRPASPYDVSVGTGSPDRGIAGRLPRSPYDVGAAESGHQDDLDGACVCGEAQSCTCGAEIRWAALPDRVKAVAARVFQTALERGWLAG